MSFSVKLSSRGTCDAGKWLHEQVLTGPQGKACLVDWAGCHLLSIPFYSSLPCSLPGEADHREVHHPGSLTLLRSAARRPLKEAKAPSGLLAMVLTAAACGSSHCATPFLLGSTWTGPPPTIPCPQHPLPPAPPGLEW